MTYSSPGLGLPRTAVSSYPVIGVVVSLEDPDNLGRVKVKFPTLKEEAQSYWARIASPMGGAKRGFWAIPEVDDEVLVMFVHGDTQKPVIVGAFWNNVDKTPVEVKASGIKGSLHSGKFGKAAKASGVNPPDNDTRFWRSRSGHLIMLDDKSGSEVLEIWDSSRKLSLRFDSAEGVIELNNAAKDIHITAKENITFTAGKSIKYHASENFEGETMKDIKLKAGMNYKLEAKMSVEIKAKMQCKIEGKLGFEAKGLTAKVEADTMGTFKGGAMVKLEGGAMAQVQGGIVMIN